MDGVDSVWEDVAHAPSHQLPQYSKGRRISLDETFRTRDVLLPQRRK